MLLGSQNWVHQHPKHGNNLYCTQNRLYKPLRAFYTHCHWKNGLQEPIQSGNKLLLERKRNLKTSTRLFGSQNELLESFQACNMLCVSQNGVHELLQASNKLCCSGNALSEPLDAFNMSHYSKWSPRFSKTPATSFIGKQTPWTFTSLPHAWP